MPKPWLVAVAASLFLELFGVNWKAIDERISREFPQVQHVTIAQLQDQLATGSAAQPLIVDVREAEEFAVSHLHDAVNLQTAAAIADQLDDPNRPVVVYCSVGYRSAAVASELQAMGFENVRNLQHSIFAWANQGLPMENAGGETSKVHPYNRIWGSLVEPDLRQYQP